MTRSTLFTLTLALVSALLCGGMAIAAKTVRSEAPEEMRRWSFLLGKWEMKSERYSLDGPVLEKNAGKAVFTPALNGLRIQELHSTTLGGQPMETLNIFTFHPERKQWEIARTDSLHHSFGVTQGTGSGETIVLFERDPDPDSRVSRRYTYTRRNDDEFSLLLEFSEDKGKTWVRRNETVYTRAR